MQTMIRYAIRGRFALTVLGIFVLAVAYPVSTRLQTDQSVQSLFGDDDPTIREYQNLKQWFGKDDILVLMYRDENLASHEGIERSEVLTKRIKSLQGVTATLSPWVLNRAADGMSGIGLSLNGGRLGDQSLPRLMRDDDPVGRGLNRIFTGYTHSADYKHAAVVVMIEEAKATETVQSIRRLADRWSDEPLVSEVSLIGEPVLVDQAFALVRRDGNRLAVITVILLSLVVTVSLLDVRLVVLLSLVIAWSVIVTKAVMHLIGFELSLIASILTAIVTVVAVTAILHLGVRYHGRRRRGYSQAESTGEVMSVMAWPIFWTCATDAAGFAALWFSEILPVRQFGLMVAMAAMAVFVAILIFSPTCLMLPEFRLGSVHLPYHYQLTRILRRACFRFAAWFVRRKITTAMITIGLIVATVFVVLDAETETSFLRNFRDNSPIVVDYKRVENHLGGAGVWELVIEVDNPITKEQLSQVRELEYDLLRQLGGTEGLSKAISIADATEVIGRSTAGKWLPAQMRIEAMRTRLPSFVGALISDPLDGQAKRKLRIMLRSPEGLAAAAKRHLMERTRQIAIEHVRRWKGESDFDDSSVFVTGYYVIMTRLVDQLVSDQWKCFGASALMIWLLMWMATKSLRRATAALVPNLLPAFLVLSTVSMIGGRINMGAAMIAAVSVGLSIDGSVHLLMVYRRRRKIGRVPEQAAVSAAGNIGAPLLLATVALVAGFSILSSSEFVPTATFGTLVAWTLVIGTVINLSVLPALVRVAAD